VRALRTSCPSGSRGGGVFFASTSLCWRKTRPHPCERPFGLSATTSPRFRGPVQLAVLAAEPTLTPTLSASGRGSKCQGAGFLALCRWQKIECGYCRATPG